MATDYLLYALALPEATRGSSRARARQNVSIQALLNQTTGQAEPISTDPTEQTLSGTYAGQYSEKMATELRELASNSTIESVPLAGQQSATPLDAYYAIESANVEPRSAQSTSMWRYDLTLREQETRASAYRATAVEQSQEDHPFGNGTTAEVGIPATASSVQWYDRETGATADPTAVATRSAELGDVTVYDAEAAPYTNPEIVYDVAYGDQGPVDVRAWDERGVGSKLDASGNLAWQKVFSTAHQYAGERILDNGLFRVRVDQTPALSVEYWDDANSSWASQSLGSSSWSLVDVDVRRVGLAQVRARCVFSDGSSTYPLDCTVIRGWTDPLWARTPDESDPFPTGLEDLLSPVASSQIYDPNADQTLVAREDL